MANRVLILFLILVSLLVINNCSKQQESTTTTTLITTTTSLPPPTFSVTPYVSSSEVYLLGTVEVTDSHKGIDFLSTTEAVFRAVCGGTFRKTKCQNELTGKWQVNTDIVYDSKYFVRYGFEPFGNANDPTPADLQYNMLIADGTRIVTGEVLGALLSSGEGSHVHFGPSKNDQWECPMSYFTAAASEEILLLWRHDHSSGNPICTDHNLY
jgi:hypothetical protein